MSEQLIKLTKPFNPRYISKKGQFNYVSHSEVSQNLLGIVGPHNIEVKHIIYVDGKVDGVILALTCTIDGREVTVEEAGGIGTRSMSDSGELLKEGISDALKRCAMRLGLGLHLWAFDSAKKQDNYYLHDTLEAKLKREESNG